LFAAASQNTHGYSMKRKKKGHPHNLKDAFTTKNERVGKGPRKTIKNRDRGYGPV